VAGDCGKQAVVVLAVMVMGCCYDFPVSFSIIILTAFPLLTYL